MYFSDEIYLVTETLVKNELKQFETIRDEEQVWAELTSVGASEVSDAGVNGFKAEARAIVHMEDYSRQSIIRIPEGNLLLPAGYYEIYRSYLKGDCIELYLKEKEGIQ